MSTTITDQDQIPKAPFYVLATDDFMSGWGPATGKANILILPCRDEKEAATVEKNARARSETRDVRIVSEAPGPSSAVLYSLMTPEDAPRWYRPGGFT